MEAVYDLDAFAHILTSNGYDGYFLTQSGYPGKLKESILKYLEACEKGMDKGPPSEFQLESYLQWKGDDKPNIRCTMRVCCKNGAYNLARMEIIRKDCFGHLLKQSVVSGLSVATMPSAKDAIALVSDQPKVTVATKKKRFGS